MATYDLVVIAGPHAGDRLQISEGQSLSVGRDPGPGGWVLTADATVSRRHAEFRLGGGSLFLINHSENGTEVEGETILDQVILQVGSCVRVGEAHVVEVAASAPGQRAAAAPPRRAPDTSQNATVDVHRGPEALVPPRPLAPAPPKGAPAAVRAPSAQPPRKPSGGAPAARSQEPPGLLQRPMVRAMLVVYALILVVVVVVLGRGSEESATAAWTAVAMDYEAQYSPEGLSPETKAERLGRGRELAAELSAYEASGRLYLARRACAELMALDRDATSPIYIFAAKRQGLLAVKK